ncbi:MAG: acetolactate synthase small subunit [Planctomycetota bacterium]|nr:MAG: acetolactate synthase small subunit [Planctomycetota bacterium]
MSEDKVNKHVISLVVNNTPGVLVRVGQVFAKRGFNIDSLVVSKVVSGSARMTVVCSGDGKVLWHMIKSLNKLIDVISAYDHTGRQVVERELALFKVEAIESRTELFQILEVFRAKAVDVSEKSIVVEITGTTDKLDAFESLLKKFNIIEMVRSGKVLLVRGPDVT